MAPVRFLDANGLKVAGLLGLAGLLFLTSCLGTQTATCGSETCESNQRCVAGECRDTCIDDLDCVLGTHCEGAVCLTDRASSSASGASGGSSSGSIQGASSSPASSSAASSAISGSLSSSSSSSANVGSGSSSTSGSSGATSGTGTTSSASGSSSSATIGSGTSSSISSSASSSSASSSSSSSSSSGDVADAGVTDAGCPCEAQAGECFTGACLGDGGCQYTYACPGNQMCISPGTCKNFDTNNCARVIVANRAFLGCFASFGWYESRDWCRDNYPGFDLASVRNPQENAAVATLVVNSKWIGLTDRDDLTQETFFVWSDNSVLGYGLPLHTPPWCGNQPDDNGTEDCVELNGDNDCWNDTECGNATGFICSR